MALADLNTPDTSAVERGFANLERHIRNAMNYGITPVVAINRFVSDDMSEIQVLERLCRDYGVRVVLSEGWAKGGQGCEELARVVVEEVAKAKHKYEPLYELSAPLKDKIETVARRTYGARGVVFSAAAEKKLARIEKLGLSDMAVCIAKTQKSFTDDESVVGAPSGFDINIRDVEIASGAGFVIPVAGQMMRMPGLPAKPMAIGMDIDENGVITGLS